MSDPPLRWSDWPAARMPVRAALAASLLLGTVLVIASMDRWLAVVGAVVLLSSVADQLLPTHFALDPSGVTVRNPLRSARRAWDRFGGWRRVPEGFWLPGRTRSALLRRLRGVILRCPGREADVEALLRRHLGEPETARERDDA